jgi:hypothetical protein
MRERSGTPGPSRTAASPAPEAGLVPGKQTLTSQLDAAIQRRAKATTTADGPDVHAAAAHGTSGAATTLPYVDQIQRSFGRHDIGRIQAHVDDRAAGGAGAMGASAFAVGEHVAFAGAPDLHTAAHEAAHVVQQRGGVQLMGGVGEVGDTHEQHADAVADLVVRGASSEALLDKYAGQPAGHAGAASPASASTPAAVQRHAFVRGKQIKKSDSIATGAIAAFVTDHVVRDYHSRDELEDHAAGQTDYLGNLPDGTWMRFSPTGTNVLGEMHTEVTLRMVAPAVGSKSFIYEAFSNDDLAEGSHLKAAYDTASADRFEAFGVSGEKDKKQFGAESIFPKLGFGLSLALPYLRGEAGLGKLTREGGYDGQPIQGSIMFAWEWGKDIKAQVEQQRKAKQTVLPRQAELCKAVTAAFGDLDAFLTSLPHPGWFGDAFVDNDRSRLLPQLAAFATAAIDALVEQATIDPSSRMTADQKTRFGGSTTDDDKKQLFAGWRNFEFEDSVKDAVARGVRYAGMGAAHLYHLQDVGLPSGAHAYDMSSDALDEFKAHTATLRRRAIKQ